jgi:hypothetical protein
LERPKHETLEVVDALEKKQTSHLPFLKLEGVALKFDARGKRVSIVLL